MNSDIESKVAALAEAQKEHSIAADAADACVAANRAAQARQLTAWSAVKCAEFELCEAIRMSGAEPEVASETSA